MGAGEPELFALGAAGGADNEAAGNEGDAGAGAEGEASAVSVCEGVRREVLVVF